MRERRYFALRRERLPAVVADDEQAPVSLMEEVVALDG
jgi:hypothetical protein